jgi:hypothetical protein
MSTLRYVRYTRHVASGGQDVVLGPNGNRVGLHVAIWDTGSFTVKFGETLTAHGDGFTYSNQNGPAWIWLDQIGDIVKSRVSVQAGGASTLSFVEILEIEG